MLVDVHTDRVPVLKLIADRDCHFNTAASKITYFSLGGFQRKLKLQQAAGLLDCIDGKSCLAVVA